MTTIQVSNYRVLFDQQAQGFRASAGTAMHHNGELTLAFYFASDGDRGVRANAARSGDEGKTWDAPRLFGPEITDAATSNLSTKIVGVTRQGTELVTGYHIPNAVRAEHAEDTRWRPCDIIIGRRGAGQESFQWSRYASGEFLGEGFMDGGIVMRSGRIVLSLWGAASKGANWECGVMLSDDDGRRWRYRRIGLEADPAIRQDPQMPAGYNEQSLFELNDGSIVSIIRGREKLGAVAPDALDETYFFRSISKDGGETWSPPAITNLPGTGASLNGLVLPDGSLVLPVRICKHARRTWVRPPDPQRFGLHLARSFDGGVTWRTEAFFQHDPAGQPFDDYYNVMNGQFVRMGEARWIYEFGHFEYYRDRHRILSLDFTVPSSH